MPREFELVSKAPHYDVDGTEYNQGDIVTTDIDMVEKYPNKFKEVTGMPKKKAAPAEAEKDETTEEETEEEETAPPAPKTEAEPLGTEVTEDFPHAKDAGLRVFKDGSLYFVTEADMPSKALNEKPLKKKDVEGFIKQQVA